MEGSLTNNFTIYLMLVVCIILLSVDCYELYKISLSWSYIHKFDPILFNTCIKKELIIKTIYASLSFFSALASFLLTLFLTISIEFFIEKLLVAYMHFIYVIFGPMMLAFSLFGLLNWNQVVQVCDRKNYSNQIFSFGNAVSLIGCFTLSLFVTIGVTIYETVLLYINSIIRRENGSKALRSVFWWVIMKTNPNAIRGLYGQNGANPQEPNNAEDNRLNNQNV